jgi:hypothetical protein
MMGRLPGGRNDIGDPGDELWRQPPMTSAAPAT